MHGSRAAISMLILDLFEQSRRSASNLNKISVTLLHVINLLSFGVVIATRYYVSKTFSSIIMLMISRLYKYELCFYNFFFVLSHSVSCLYSIIHTRRTILTPIYNFFSSLTKRERINFKPFL